MNKEELLSNYDLLNDDELALPKASILELFDKDNYAEDRAFLIDRINEWADTDDDMFFYDMLACLRYILENTIAYTTREKIICLNYPCPEIPEDNDRWRRWYFVYCHECLHQLWDTFRVEDEVKKKYGECDHRLMNIAADCVINDYLANIAKSHKLPLDVGIYPETLKNECGIDYDRKVDTQFTLYEKLKALPENQQNKMKQKDDQNTTDKNGQEGKPAKSGQGDTQNGDGKDKGQDKDGKDKGQGQGQGKDGKGQGPGQGKDGKDKGPGQSKDGTDSGQIKGKDAEGAGNGKGKGDGEGDIVTRQLIEDAARHSAEICKKYANNIVGKLKDFTGKCKLSKELKRPDLVINSPKGQNSWNKVLLNECKAFVHKKLQLQKQYKPTYSRVKRGERSFAGSDLRGGRIIKQGREEIKGKIGFDIALYIDTSGSMSNCIDSVFSAAYGICDTLKKVFGKDAIVDASKINLRSFIFTTTMKEIKYGTKCSANGGTYEFSDLLSDVNKRGANAFLNIIITDGEFGTVDDSKVAEVISNMEGMFIMVTNNHEGTFDSTERAVTAKCGNRFKVIYADPSFTVK